MSDTKKYYWLKLDKNFFKRHDIRIVESMPNGKAYILLYLKLLLESIDHEGLLRFNESIPYNEDMIATITDTNVDIVKSGLQIFRQLDLLEVSDDHTIFMKQTSLMLGGETEFAIKKREYRERQKLLSDNSKTNKDNVRQEIELEKDIDIEKDIERESKKNKKESGNGKSSISRPSPDSIPTINDISEFLKSKDIRESKIDFTANKFVNYYAARGWMIDGQPIYDWKALIEYWLEIQINRTRNGYTGKKVAPVPDWLQEFEDLLEKGE
jgi:predicted phage replisome organizer